MSGSIDSAAFGCVTCSLHSAGGEADQVRLGCEQLLSCRSRGGRRPKWCWCCYVVVLALESSLVGMQLCPQTPKSSRTGSTRMTQVSSAWKGWHGNGLRSCVVCVLGGPQAHLGKSRIAQPVRGLEDRQSRTLGG